MRVKPMKLTVAFGARSLSARRWADANPSGEKAGCKRSLASADVI
jgi:hypothetical protein